MKKSGVRLSKKQRRVIVESFIKTYQKLNNGLFPSMHVTHKEVGGSYYIVREIVRDIIQENRVLAPPKDSKIERNMFGTVPNDYPFGSISMEPQNLLTSMPNGLLEASADKLILESIDQSIDDNLYIGQNVSAKKPEELVKGDPVLIESLVGSLDDSDGIKVEETDEQKEFSVSMISEISQNVEVESFPLHVSVKLSESEDRINLNGTSLESVPDQAVLDSVTSTISAVDQNIGQSQKGNLSDELGANKISAQSSDIISNIEGIDTDVNGSEGQKVIIKQYQERAASEPVVSSDISTVVDVNGTSSESNMQEEAMCNNDTFQSGKNGEDDPTLKLSEQEATMRKDEAVQGSSDPHKDRKPARDRVNLESWEEISKKPAHEDNPFSGFVKACISAFSKLFSK